MSSDTSTSGESATGALDQRGCTIGVSQAGRVDRRHKSPVACRSASRTARVRSPLRPSTTGSRPTAPLPPRRRYHRGHRPERVDRGEIGARGDGHGHDSPLHRRGEQQPFTVGAASAPIHPARKADHAPTSMATSSSCPRTRRPARIVDKDEGGVDRLSAESLAGNELIEARLDRLDVHPARTPATCRDRKLPK